MNVLKVFYPARFPLVADDCASFPAMHVTPACSYPGMMVEIINNLAADSGFKIQPISALNYGFDIQNFTDINSQMFTMMQNGDFDLLALPLQKTTPREERFQFSNVLYNTPSRALKREQRQKYDQTWSFFETYDSYTWISLGIAWLIQWILCVTFRYVESRLSGQTSTRLSESAWQILRIQLLQPEQVPFRTKAGKFSLFLFSLVQCTLLLGIFSSFILASILHPKSADQRNSMRMFLRHLRNKEYVLVTHNSQESIFELINSSIMYPYANLKQTFENNPLQIVGTVEEAFDMVLARKAMMFQLNDDASYYHSMSLCGLTSMEEEMPVINSYLMFRKNFTHMDRINIAIRANWANIQLLRTKYARYMKSKQNCKERPINKALKFAPFSGLFILCSAIIFVSVAVFFVEMSHLFVFKPAKTRLRRFRARQRIKRSINTLNK